MPYSRRRWRIWAGGPILLGIKLTPAAANSLLTYCHPVQHPSSANPASPSGQFPVTRLRNVFRVAGRI